MAPIEIRQASITNKLASDILLCWRPAFDLAIPANGTLPSFSAELEQIFVFEPSLNNYTCYTPDFWVHLEPKTVISIANGDNGPVLEYQRPGAAQKKMELKRKTRGHMRDFGVSPLKPSTILPQPPTNVTQPSDGTQTQTQTPNGTQTSNSTQTSDGTQQPGAQQPGVQQPDVQQPVNGSSPSAPPASSAPQPGNSGVDGHFDNMTPQPGSNTVGPGYVTVTPQTMEDETRRHYSDLHDLLSVINLLTAARFQEEQQRLGRPLTISSDAALYMKTVADASFKAPLDPWLSTVLTVEESWRNELVDVRCRRDEVHYRFLRSLLPDYPADSDIYLRFDKVLHDFVDKVSRLDVGGGENLHYTLIQPYVPSETIPGSQVRVLAPKIKVLFVTGAASTFTEIVKHGKKTSQAQSTNLKFHYCEYTYRLNSRLFRALHGDYDKLLQDYTRRSLQSMRDRISIKVPEL